MTFRRGLGALLLAALMSCTQQASTRQAHPMGEPVKAGVLKYTVLEAEWHNQLNIGGTERIPKNRFLLVRLTVTNDGAKESHVPMLDVITDKGESTRELDDVKNLPEWIGLLRAVPPGESISGRIVFDLAPQNLKLEVVDATDPADEKAALVEVPMSLKMSDVLNPAPVR